MKKTIHFLLPTSFKDEAHRYTINNHRILKKKLFTSEIDLIPNVGQKKKIFYYFKKYEIKNANYELYKVPV